jgi:choline dehydrogenase-like flavoprotein
MSTLPATTLVLNSFGNSEFPKLSNVGKRFTAHFVSTLIARVPRHILSHADHVHEAELGAVYISGMKDEAQYHLQLSGVAYAQCQDESVIHGICKKYSANSIPRECIDVSQDFVVVSCSSLGELDYKNKRNQFNLTNNGQCLTTNGQLTLHLNDQDKQLWDLMDSITSQVMSKLSPSAHGDGLEYWHESDKSWRNDAPPLLQIRSKFLVHDASTMWIGISGDTEAPVSLGYRLQGTDNVYITGGALWPTGGSWNPVLTIVAMAMHLADTMYEGTRDKTDNN